MKLGKPFRIQKFPKGKKGKNKIFMMNVEEGIERTAYASGSFLQGKEKTDLRQTLLMKIAIIGHFQNLS